MTGNRSSSGFAILAALAIPLAAGAQGSFHEEQALEHAGDPLPEAVAVAEAASKLRDPIVQKIVYGYYPYWVTGYAELRWELLTHVAWFAVALNSNGTASNANGWPGSWTGLVDTAHENGVRVDVAFTLFSGTGIQTLVTSATNRATAIDTIIAAIEDGNADGAAIDFEGVPAAAASGFATFLAELRAGLDDAGLEDKQISVAGPAVDWSDVFDLSVILDSIDVYFIMGYDYFWSGSSRAGPTGILLTDSLWRPYSYGSELRSMADCSAQVTEAERAKIVIGVPYYGREWTTSSDQLAATTIANIGSVTYNTARDDIDESGMTCLWDERSLTPWYTWNDGVNWHQVYYDDEESLAWKYRFAAEQDLGGIGIWALRYDSNHTELWDEIEGAFAGPFAPHPGDRLAPVPVAELPYEGAGDTSDIAAGGNYFNWYSCDDSLPEWGREFVYRVELCHPGTLTATVSGDGGSVDNDVHILTALSEQACVARGNTAASWAVQPGTYFVVVDTYVDNAVLQSGPFGLTIAGEGIPNPQCEGELVCLGGECVDPGSDADSDS
ncbi:MAG TPA: glycosyl hydrolase family 18 protein, partial [Polyangia bacterium]|nr:glycosyl hydrolase family 18 protein [Polyangia bacterium]